jgi:hypothetical protein
MILTREMVDNPKVAIPILKAIANRESGRGNNLTEEQWQQAFLTNPLIGIAVSSFFPEIAKFLVGDKVGAITGAVKKIVTQVARTENPEEARKRLQADPKSRDRAAAQIGGKSPPSRRRSDNKHSSTSLNRANCAVR